MAAIVNFSKTFKKSPAHLHMVGNVIVEIWINSDFKSFCTHKIFEVDLWWSFWIVVASLKIHLHIPMFLEMSC